MVTLESLSQQMNRLTELLSLQARKLYRFADLAALTSISEGQLRVWDKCRFIPGRVKKGRMVLFRAGPVGEWMDRGMPLTRQRG